MLNLKDMRPHIVARKLNSARAGCTDNDATVWGGGSRIRGRRRVS